MKISFLALQKICEIENREERLAELSKYRPKGDGKFRCMRIVESKDKAKHSVSKPVLAIFKAGNSKGHCYDTDNKRSIIKRSDVVVLE